MIINYMCYYKAFARIGAIYNFFLINKICLYYSKEIGNYSSTSTTVQILLLFLFLN
jgi:hypothetical protein